MTRRVANAAATPASATSSSWRTAVKEIARITANDTNVVQVRRCRGCLVVWRPSHQRVDHNDDNDNQLRQQQQDGRNKNHRSISNKRKKQQQTSDDAAMAVASSHNSGRGRVRSFGGRGTLILSDQRIIAYHGATRLFHAEWYDATTTNFQLHIQYSKDTLEPLLCLTVTDAATLFSSVVLGATDSTTTASAMSSTTNADAFAASPRRRHHRAAAAAAAPPPSPRRDDRRGGTGYGAMTTTSAAAAVAGDDIEYRFETPHASVLKRRIQYILHWYLDLECAPGTQRRYASEIFC